MQWALQEDEQLFHVILQYLCPANTDLGKYRNPYLRYSLNTDFIKMCYILWKNINYNLPSSCWLHFSKPC
jgi:peptidoglycan/xylan/chitin deacetylase (PgdA/CDA1 family)